MDGASIQSGVGKLGRCINQPVHRARLVWFMGIVARQYIRIMNIEVRR
jgi:hypothetical protein